MLKKDSFS